MPRVALLIDARASADLKAAWAHHIDNYPGLRIIHVKATLNHSLLAFAVCRQWYPLYEEVKQLVGERSAYLFTHAISQPSNCPLCTTFFREIVIEYGEWPEDLHLTKVEEELLTFGAAIASNRGEVSDSLYESIHQVVIDDCLTPYRPVTQLAYHA